MKSFMLLGVKWESRIIEFNGEVDHVHLLIEYNPKVHALVSVQGGRSSEKPLTQFLVCERQQ